MRGTLETQNENSSDDRILQKFPGKEDLVAPGVPIVRASTPRPLSIAPFFPKNEQQAISATASDFPIEAPAAPPLPEEYEDRAKGTSDGEASILSSVGAEPSSNKASEFIWLFTYGLEMDAAYLNSVDRLNGLAHYYGPAVLKGYQLHDVALRTGQVVATIAKSQAPEKEVWGVLYRIPRRLTEQEAEAPSILDNALAADPFKAINVVAYETYRKRAVPCITYMATANAQQEAALTGTEQQLDHTFAQHLLDVARRQKLPDTYLEELALYANHPISEPVASTRIRGEQDTEPLPVIGKNALLEELTGSAKNETASAPTNGWLLALALYLVMLLMATLTLAVLQALGFWNQVFTASFTPLGAPWYMLIYGLLGGCISCMMTLGSRPTSATPGFVIVTWFTRPYLGALLAALAYLVLTSGLFVLSVVPEQRYAFFSVVGAIAGICEGRILFKQK